MHPAVVKANQFGGLANKYGWKGHLTSEIFDRQRVTTLIMTRGEDEIFQSQWVNRNLSSARYSIFGRIFPISNKVELIRYLSGPQVMWLFREFPDMNRPLLVEQFRRLPFDWENDDDETIIDSLIGRKIYWYNRELSKIETDTVGKRSKQFRIAPVGHRKLLHCVCLETNFRSILLDQLIQVGH